MTTKIFDAVKLMRDLRAKLSREMEGMSPQERMRCIREKAASTPLGKAIAQGETMAARQAGSADRPPPSR